MGASQTLMCMQVTWVFEKSASSDSAGLGAGQGKTLPLPVSQSDKPVLLARGLFRRV